MIPILYDYNETTFATNGLGRLSDALRVEVTEERNGIFELEMDYPLTGIHFDEILPGRIIACTHDEDGDLQPFDIYSASKPIEGVVTFYAHHISYRLNEIINRRFHTYVSTMFSPAGVWAMFLDEPSGSLANWSFSSDITAQKVFPFVPAPIRQLLGGTEGSMLDLFGGEFLFDGFNISLLSARGANNGVRVVYRSNLTEYEEELDYSESFNAIYPYWVGETESGATKVTGAVQYGSGSLPHGRNVVVPYDFAQEFEGEPTAAQLNSAAASMLAAKTPWLPSHTFDIDFVQLWQTEEYQDVAPLLKVKLCDTVLVTFPEYGILDMPVKVVKVVWDTLADRYKEMTLGTPASSFADTLMQGSDQRQTDMETRVNALSDLVAANTTAITSKSNLLSTATYSGTIASIAAEQSQAVSINVARTGYTPIGIVGVTKSGGGSGYVDIAAYSLSGTTATVQCHNANSGARSNIGVTVTVLYVAN